MHSWLRGDIHLNHSFIWVTPSHVNKRIDPIDYNTLKFTFDFSLKRLYEIQSALKKDRDYEKQGAVTTGGEAREQKK